MFELIAIGSLLVNVVCWLIGAGLILKYLWFSVSFQGGFRQSGHWMVLCLLNIMYLTIDVGVVQFIKWLTGHVGTELLAVGGSVVAGCWSLAVFALRKKWINAGQILTLAEH